MFHTRRKSRPQHRLLLSNVTTGHAEQSKKQRAKNFVPAISRSPSHPLLRGCSPRFSATLPLNRRRHSARGQSQVVAKLFCIAHWENCRRKIHTILRTNPTYPVYCVWTSATASAGWLLLLPVALCGTEVAFRGCCALCGTGPSEEIPQPYRGFGSLLERDINVFV